MWVFRGRFQGRKAAGSGIWVPPFLNGSVKHKSRRIWRALALGNQSWIGVINPVNALLIKMVLFEIPNMILFMKQTSNMKWVCIKINDWEQTTSYWKNQFQGVDLHCPKVGCKKSAECPRFGGSLGFCFILLFFLLQPTPTSLFGTEIVWHSKNAKNYQDLWFPCF